MKARRHMKILELINQQPVETQEELARYLSTHGMSVTQATISRDIKELNLVKVPRGDGRYRYVLPVEQPSTVQVERMQRMVRECVVGLDHAGNVVVVRSLTGTAAVMGEAIDSLKWGEIVGTVAGDNTVFVLVRTSEDAARLVDKFREFMF